MDIQVLFSVRGAEIKGKITHDSANRDKIVFVQGYRPERSDSWRGNLPKDGEEWFCSVMRDTNEGDTHRGALLVRLVRRVEETVELRYGKVEFYGVREPSLWAVRGKKEENVGHWSTKVSEVLRESFNKAHQEWYTALDRAKEEIRNIQLPFTNGMLGTVKVPCVIGGCQGMLAGGVSDRPGIRSWSFYSEGMTLQAGIETPLVAGIEPNGAISDLNKVIEILGRPIAVHEGIYALTFKGTDGETRQFSCGWDVLIQAYPATITSLREDEDSVMALQGTVVEGKAVEAKSWDSVLGRAERLVFGVKHLRRIEPAHLSGKDCGNFKDEVIAFLQKSIRPASERLAEARQKWLDGNWNNKMYGHLTCSRMLLTDEENAGIKWRTVTIQCGEPESDDGYRAASYWTEKVSVPFWTGLGRQFEISLLEGETDHDTRRRLVRENVEELKKLRDELAEMMGEEIEFDGVCDPTIYSFLPQEDSTTWAYQAEVAEMVRVEDDALSQAIQAGEAWLEECTLEAAKAVYDRRSSEIRAHAIEEAGTQPDQNAWGFSSVENDLFNLLDSKSIYGLSLRCGPAYGSLVDAWDYVEIRPDRVNQILDTFASRVEEFLAPIREKRAQDRARVEELTPKAQELQDELLSLCPTAYRENIPQKAENLVDFIASMERSIARVKRDREIEDARRRDLEERQAEERRLAQNRVSFSWDAPRGVPAQEEPVETKAVNFTDSGDGRHFNCSCGALHRASKSEQKAFLDGATVTLTCSSCRGTGSAEKVGDTASTTVSNSSVEDKLAALRAKFGR